MFYDNRKGVIWKRVHSMITTETARELKLQGWDTFDSNCIGYINNMHQIWFAVNLNNEAYKILKDTILIARNQQLSKECALRVNEIRNDYNDLTEAPLLDKYTKNYLLDYVKIALALELHLKARLVEQGYIVHYINNSGKLKLLYKKQKSEPITITEFLDIAPYMYDETKMINLLPGLKDSSLEFSHILNQKNYLEKLKIDSEYINIIDDVRKIRNTIHLPGNIPNMSYKKDDKNIKLLLFINEYIINNTNKMIRENKLKFKELEKFDS